MATGVWYGFRVPGMPYEITPFATKGVYRAPLPMVPPLPSGHAWVRAVRARGRDDSHMLGFAQYGRTGGTTVLRDLMVCECTSAVPLSLLGHPPFLSFPPLGVMLGLIVVAYRSKHADDGTSEVSSVMNLTNSLRSVPVWVLEFDQVTRR